MKLKVFFRVNQGKLSGEKEGFKERVVAIIGEDIGFKIIVYNYYTYLIKYSSNNLPLDKSKPSRVNPS